MSYFIVFDRGARILAPSYREARFAVDLLCARGYAAWVEGALS